MPKGRLTVEMLGESRLGRDETIRYDGIQVKCIKFNNKSGENLHYVTSDKLVKEKK